MDTVIPLVPDNVRLVEIFKVPVTRLEEVRSRIQRICEAWGLNNEALVKQNNERIFQKLRKKLKVSERDLETLITLIQVFDTAKELFKAQGMHVDILEYKIFEAPEYNHMRAVSVIIRPEKESTREMPAAWLEFNHSKDQCPRQN